MRTISILLLLTFSFSLYNCSDDDSTTGPVTFEDTMPLSPGNIWVYEYKDINDNLIKIDTMKVLYSITLSDGYEWYATTNPFEEDKTIYLRNSQFGLLSREKPDRDSYVAIPYPTQAGSSYNGEDMGNGITMAEHVQVQSTNETAVVPAGTFQCIKYYYSGSYHFETLWYNPDVGFIMEVLEDKTGSEVEMTTMRLRSYSLK